MFDRFTETDFASFLRRRFAHRFTRPSQTVFLLLALGVVLASARHTVATYLWRSGACLVRHFTRFYAFLGGPLIGELDGLWRIVIRHAAEQVPEGEPVRVRIDETVCKKSGSKIEPGSSFRNGAGTARQEYRTLYGVCFVLAEMRVQLPAWPGRWTSVPVGLEVYLKEETAADLGRDFARRSELGRRLLDRVAAEVGDRRVLSVQDGNYSTQYFLPDLPSNADVVGRLAKNSPLYAPPGPKPEGKPGPQPRKGALLGSPEELAEKGLPTEELPAEELPEGCSWRAHPTEEDAWICPVEAIWDSVLPGEILTVVIVCRPHLKEADSAKRRKRYLETFFTTDRSLCAEEVLAEYRRRWSVEILIREAKESFGLGKDRCRNTDTIQGINNLRLLIGAAEVLYVAETSEDEATPPEAFDRLRPWYTDQAEPKLFDLHWGLREELAAAGITPKVGLRAAPGEFASTRTAVR